jgi:hypothetical protein
MVASQMKAGRSWRGVGTVRDDGSAGLIEHL